MLASTILMDERLWTWFIFDGNGDLGVVDFQYNRPVPMIISFLRFCQSTGLPYYGMNLVQTGGIYE